LSAIGSEETLYDDELNSTIDLDPNVVCNRNCEFSTCQHLTALDRAEAAGELKKEFFPDPGLELLIQLGFEHEQAYLKSLRERTRDS